MERILDICAVIVLATCLPLLVWNKDSSGPAIRQSKENLFFVENQPFLRDKETGQISCKATLELTFSKGLIPNQTTCLSILNQLNAVWDAIIVTCLLVLLLFLFCCYS